MELVSMTLGQRFRQAVSLRQKRKNVPSGSSKAVLFACFVFLAAS